MIEVVLFDGARVRVDAEVSKAALRRMLSALKVAALIAPRLECGSI
ncbi:hypothetical protein P9272_33145 [Mesorhizobium sp. WSM4976]|nr:hypothetical protein [Mesorhizobium sp. WSM4976]MDG4898381.1 hypothetical protein [Mesorhizobium sp. WSM4976]